jgi:DNA-binding FrmR family transcriptional regulator
MLLANVRGGINSLMAEVLEDHIRHHLLSPERSSAPPHAPFNPSPSGC